MRIIKLDATNSTNAYLKNAMHKEVLDDFTVVIAKNQLKGRGQLGAEWNSEPGKNLTASILKKFSSLKARLQFSLNMVVSLAVYDTLKALQIADIGIKWPNDILSGKQKICGILIENVIQEQLIVSAIVGIGLNVNQQYFPGLKRVTSISLETGKTFAVDEVLLQLLTNLGKRLGEVEENKFEEIKAKYEALLFRKDQAATFRDTANQRFMGYIRGVSDSGKLRVELEDQLIQEYDLKEVEMLY